MTDKPVLHLTCNHTSGIVSTQHELFGMIYDIHACNPCLEKLAHGKNAINAIGKADNQALENMTKPVLSKAHYPKKNRLQLLDFDGSNDKTSFSAFKSVIGLEIQAAYSKTTVRLHMTKEQLTPMIKYAIMALGITPKDLELTA